MKYSALYKNDVVNGEGVRVTLFVSGCDHQCRGCYNKSTWNPDHGEELTDETVKSIIEALRPDHIDGISFTGGDPLYSSNVGTILKLIGHIRFRFGNSKNIWLWTGYTKQEIEEDDSSEGWRRRLILDNIDVLIDGKFVEELKDPSLAWRGSSNQNIHRLSKDV